MSKLLKSKYNITGDRCVDACLNYGELRYVDEEGLPINIEVPYDKYEEAINDFIERKKEGLVSSSIDPTEVLKRGSFTYNQAKSIANLNKIRGLRVFEIDGSIELEHILGVSGCIEYALAIWNGDSKEEALEKAIIKVTKIHGLKFIKSLNLDEEEDISQDKINKICNMSVSNLYTTKPSKIEDEIYSNIVDYKISLKKGADIMIGAIGAVIGFILVQLFTAFGSKFSNILVNVVTSMIVMIVSYIASIKLTKYISYKYIKKSNFSIIEMFNEELDFYSFNNLLTEEENDIIVQNITKGEISKLIIEIKGSVNKKISINKVISKETELILESRKNIFLPSENEVKEMTKSLIKKAFQ